MLDNVYTYMRDGKSCALTWYYDRYDECKQNNLKFHNSPEEHHFQFIHLV